MMDVIRRLALVTGGSFAASVVTKALILSLVGLGAVRVCGRAPAAVRIARAPADQPGWAAGRAAKHADALSQPSPEGGGPPSPSGSSERADGEGEGL